MKPYRFFVALLTGIGFTAVVALLLNLPSVLFVIVAPLLLSPGGIVASLLFKSQGLGNAPAVLMVNSAFYSAIAYLVLRLWLRLDDRRLRLVAAVMVVPVVLVTYFACLPSASPIWPRGMSQLSEEEELLRGGLPVGSDLDSARAFLGSHGISAYEEDMDAEGVVYQDAHERMLAEPGYRVLSAKVRTEAGQFPCGYRIDIVLVFNEKRKLERRHIERFPVCP